MDIDPIPVSLQGRIINITVKPFLMAVISLLEVIPFWLTNLPFCSILSNLKCNNQYFICYQETSTDLSVGRFAGCKSLLSGKNCTRRSLIQVISLDLIYIWRPSNLHQDKCLVSTLAGIGYCICFWTSTHQNKKQPPMMVLLECNRHP